MQRLNDEGGKIALKDPHSQDLVVVETCWNGLELQFMKVDMPTKKGNLDRSVIVQKNLMRVLWSA